MRQTLYPLRSFYLATGLTGGIWGPYLSLLLTQDGLSSAAIGSIFAIGTIVAIVVQPLWGVVVDRYRVTRVLLMLSAVAPASLAVLFNLSAPLVIAAAFAVTNVFTAPQAPVADAFAVAAANSAGTSYGTIRMFGSLGYAIASYAGGLYLVNHSIRTLWIPYALFGIAGGAVAWLLPRPSAAVSVGGTVRGGIRALLADRRFAVFLLGGFLISETMTAFNTFFVLAYRSIGGSVQDAGIAFFIASITNVPTMLLAARVIRRLGRGRTMLIAALACVVRWGLQASIPLPGLAVAVQALHGICFGFFYVSAVDYVARTTARELQATGQSVFGMVCGGIAGIVGNASNGLLLRAGGPSLMYAVCAGASVGGALCFLYVIRQTGAGSDIPAGDAL